jgi:hypothetical protein
VVIIGWQQSDGNGHGGVGIGIYNDEDGDGNRGWLKLFDDIVNELFFIKYFMRIKYKKKRENIIL